MSLQKVRSYWKSPVVKGAVVVVVVFLVAIAIKSSQNEPAEQSETTQREVTVTTVSQLAGGQQITMIGEVRSFTEADITSERAGRVTRVNGSLGDVVSAGQVLVSLENASEQAAVLQAQGVYDAAVAGAAQSGFSLADAENGLESARLSAVSAYKASYATANGVLLNNIDSLLGNPDSPNPWLRFDGQESGRLLLDQRASLKASLINWELKVATISPTSDLEAELVYAEARVRETVALLDSFIRVLSNQDDAAYQVEVSGLIARRAELLSQQSALSNAQIAIDTAEDAVERAKISASGNTISVADAQVKQALGSLRAAQASLSKTILRAPIGGTLNALDVTVGDFVGSFERVAIVANNNALEVVTYVGDFEKNLLTEGDEVLIEGAFPGVVTMIAPAVDPETKKTEVRIATDSSEISNGDTVRVSKISTVDLESNNRVFVPLSAVKFESTNGFVLQVVDGKLVQKPVELGAVSGTTIEITSGLSQTDSFVIDVRGLTVGQSVTVSQ